MEPPTLRHMQARLGHDFGAVRVHDDPRAAGSARALGARAYSVGSHIVFGPGEYRSSDRDGRALLAHELAHVVQHGDAAVNGPLALGPADDTFEREARQAAAAAPARGAARLGRASGSAVIRRSVLGAVIGGASGLAAGLLIGGLLGGWAGALILGGVLGIAGAIIGALATRSRPWGDRVQMISGAFVGDVDGSSNNIREDVLLAMDRLRVLASMTDAERSAERPAIAALPPRTSVSRDKIPKTIAALRRNAEPILNPGPAARIFDLSLNNAVGRGQQNDKADVYAIQDAFHVDWSLTNADYAAERSAVDGSALPHIADAAIPKTIDAIAKAKAAFVAGAIRHDVLAETHTVTAAEHAEVEHILNPGTGIVAAPPPPLGGPAPPPVVVNPPPMTGKGAGGPFETEMVAALKKNVGDWATDFRTLKATPGQPAFPIAQANSVATAAQGEAERYFGPYLRTASRAPAERYHPGVYSEASQLGDESTRPLGDPSRRGWIDYWMTLTDCPKPPCTQAVLNKYHYLESRDHAEFIRVREKFLSANKTDIDDAIHGWPAEGATTIFIQPYQVYADAADRRSKRWDLFTILIHEFMHVIAHPNFARVADAIGGTAQKILTEGFADLMRHDLWDGPGNLKNRIAAPESAPLRGQVEGGAFPYDASVVTYHGDYAELADAQQIDAKVGRANSKAAYMLGHVELLGLGLGTRSSSSIAGLATWKPTDAANDEIFVVHAGDTYAGVRAKTNAPPGGIISPAGVALAPGAALAPGTRLRIPGIRWSNAIPNDTLGSIAQQNRVTLRALATANGFPAGAPASTHVPAGKRMLIPVHERLP